MKFTAPAVLGCFLVAPIAAHATEVEYIVYEDVLGVDLVKGQTATPTTTLPLTFASLANGGKAKVEKKVGPTGYLRICLSYQGSTSEPWHKFCVDADESGDTLKGVEWVGNIALALYVDTTPNFGESYQLDSSDFPSSASACSTSCDDGSSCSASCNDSCIAHCSPATCGCG